MARSCCGVPAAGELTPRAARPHLPHGQEVPENASPVAQFEQSLESLEQLVEQMETGELSLEASLSAYERGVGLYRQCQQALEQAELRVRLLSDPAQPEASEPFDPPSHDG